MRSRNELERLTAAAPAVRLAIDTDEEDRILERILAADRGTRHRKPRVVLPLVGVAVAAAAVVVATGLLGRAKSPAVKAGGHQHVA